MSMQWTLTWLVKCRVRGRVSCFFTIDDHKMSSSPQVSMRKSSISHRNLLHENEKFSKTRPMVKDKDGVQVGNKFDDSNCSLSMDEDYIVFCFGEDGSFDVVKDGKGFKNHKLNYADDEERQEEVTENQMHESRSNDVSQHDNDEQYQDCIEEEAKEMGRDSYTELSDSEQSEGSNGSFAFPVLSWEWMGSPVKMPKSEGICQKKQKIRFVPFQCCRF